VSFKSIVGMATVQPQRLMLSENRFEISI